MTLELRGIPVAIFCHRRPRHLLETLESLSLNDLASRAEVTVFSDGPRCEGDVKLVEEVRAILRLWKERRDFLSFFIVERASNLGLSESIISGVDAVLSNYGRIVVLEDDLVTNRFFLNYCNDGLMEFENEERVASIHGYIYPLAETPPAPFFLRGADCWGWATWSRAWSGFDRDGSRLLGLLRKRQLEQIFDLDGAVGYTRMLEQQVSGEIDSWAIRWHASTFLAGQLTLYPPESLVKNIGLDASGTHCANMEGFVGMLSGSPIPIGNIEIVEDFVQRRAVSEWFKQNRKNELSLRVRLKRWIKRFSGVAKYHQ